MASMTRCLCLAISAARIAAHPPPSPGGWTLTWHDEFSGKSLNPEFWNVGTLKGPNGDLIPGAYGAHQLNWHNVGYVMEDDVLLEDGILRLRSQERAVQGDDPVGNFSFTTGWVHTMHKVFYTYGYVEARIRYPLGPKVHPAFWTIEERLVWGAEFDIAEYYGMPWVNACVRSEDASVDGEDFKVQTIPMDACCQRCGGVFKDQCVAAVYVNGTCHFKNSTSGAQKHHPGSTLLTTGPAGMGQHLHAGESSQSEWINSWSVMCMDNKTAADCDVTNWHTYGLRWGADGYDYYIDDVLQKSVSAADVKDFPSQDMYFVLNNGVFYNPESTDGTPFPNYADFDYLRLYTEKAGNNFAI